MRRLVPTLRLAAPLVLPLILQLGWWAATRWPLDPVAAAIAWSGDTALVLLVGSLTITPLVRWCRLAPAAPWRKPLGIAAGVYSLVHLGVYVGLDYAWAWLQIWQNVSTKRHLSVAIAALVLLVPLLITSTAGWQRRLGKRWKQLHRLVYPAAVLAGLHYLWLVKTDIRLPMVALGMIVVLLLARLVRRFIPTSKNP